MVGLLFRLFLLFDLVARMWPGFAPLLVNDKKTPIHNQCSIHLSCSSVED